jgi:hypothetical protein
MSATKQQMRLIFTTPNGGTPVWISIIIPLFISLLALLPNQSQAFTIILTNPTNGFSATAPNTLNLRASVSVDSGTTNTGVGFYETTIGFIGSVLASPFSITTNLGAGTYQFFAVATNSLGEIRYSRTNAIAITNIPLSINLQSPTNGFRVASPANVSLLASAVAGSGATLRGAAFFDVTNGLLISFSSQPYYKVAAFQPGIYKIYAVVTNSLGDIAFSVTNTVTIYTVPLTVALGSPTNGTCLGAPATVPLSATVDAGSGATAQGVGFYDVLNGFLTNALASPFTNSVALNAGAYGIYAVATNSLGNIAYSETNTVTVTNTPFTVSLGNPTNGSSFGQAAPVTLSASVNPGSGATAQGVGFYDVANGLLASAMTAPFNTNAALSPGTYQIYAAATNSLHAITFSATNTIIVTNSYLTVTMSSPVNGGVYGVRAGIKYQASVSLGAGGSAVSSVSFYAMSNSDINLLCTDTSAPYSNQVAVLTEGTYGIFAVVVTSNSQVAVSRMATITVTNGVVVRGPYLCSRGETNITIRWRTADTNFGRVRYGTTLGNLTDYADDAASSTNHSVTLARLVPETKYYYSVGTPGRESIGGSNCFFSTAPPIGSIRSTRIWFLSDFGEQDDAMESTVRDTYLNFVTTNGRATDVWLTGGDNEQTDEGQDWLFQTGMFAVYSNVLENTCIYPGVGNHDSITNCAFWSIFALPYQGQAGGYPSDSPHYFSFDYASIHFISLDSFNAPTTKEGPMYHWLTNDLAHNRQQWVIVNFHAPVYSKAHYDSDTLAQSLAMRTNFVPVLEDYGVDLVINGHAHTLQRTSLLKGHYGLSTTFSETNKIDGGNGRMDGAGPYRKTNGVGTVYMVAPTGCSVVRNATNPHPACIYTINDTAGFLIFDVNTNRLDFQMITSSGDVADYFTMIKPPAKPCFAAPPCLTNGICTLVIRGTPGESYTVQFTDRLGNAWQNGKDVTLSSEGLARVQDDAGGVTNRFYRLVYRTQ